MEDYFHEYAKESSACKTTEKGHGRIELQRYYFSGDIGWLEQRNEWDGLQGTGMVKLKVIGGEEESEFTQYFITSLTDVDEFTYAVRKHW